MPVEEKNIYLTFDDGPVPGVTEFVLDELRKNDIKATFFSIGDNIYKHPGIFSKIIADGHAVGNHTFNHLSGWRTKKEKYIDNVSLCEKEILKHSPPSSSRLFRPPYGRIKRSQIGMLNDYKIVMWDVLTHDYAQSLAPETCLEGSIHAVRPGSIVVFHDSYKAERNLRFVLPAFIRHFKKLGYNFRSLS